MKNVLVRWRHRLHPPVFPIYRVRGRSTVKSTYCPRVARDTHCAIELCDDRDCVSVALFCLGEFVLIVLHVSAPIPCCCRYDSTNRRTMVWEPDLHVEQFYKQTECDFWDSHTPVVRCRTLQMLKRLALQVSIGRGFLRCRCGRKVSF